MKYRGHLIVSLALLSSTGCSSIIDGHGQQVAVETTPPHANCVFKRKGATIAAVQDTPGSVTIDKSHNDITIACSKAGYADATAINESDADAWSFSNVLWGTMFPVALSVDWATGAINKYDAQVAIALQPNQSGVQQLSAVPLATPQQQVATSQPLVPPKPAPVQIASTGGHRVFGIGVLPVDPASAAAQSLGLDFGVRVMVVQEGSIAARSGVVPGDILVSLDGEAVNQKGDVQRIVASRAEGSIVSVHLVRNGTPMDLATQL